MQTDIYESSLVTAKETLQTLLVQFKQGLADEENLQVKSRAEAFERDILARQECCTQEFDSQVAKFAQLKEQNPNRAELYEKAEQSARRQYLSSMTFLCDTLRDKVAQS